MIHFVTFEQADSGKGASVRAGCIEAVWDGDERTGIRTKTGHTFWVKEPRAVVLSRIEAVFGEA